MYGKTSCMYDDDSLYRRLRDKLIEDERLALAMEVSTKCGLDTSGVWSAWGKACLYSGDYTAAREKFSHCLKVGHYVTYSSYY